jgi:tetratricopeptide (TPR) repeat protein
VTSSTGDTQSGAPRAAFEAAVALQRQGDYAGAIAQYRRLLETIPDHPQILNMCAVATVETGDLNNAAELLEKAVKNAPDFGDAWVNLGLIRQKQGNNPAAADAYDRFRALMPDSPVGHSNFANVCQLMKRFDEAAEAYEKALSFAPGDSSIWSNYARACLHLGEWEKSLQAANRSLTHSPGNTGALAIKSAALLELGRDEELAGLVDFDRLIENKDLTAPQDYADLKSFNEALCEHCLAHPSLVYEPSQNTTMKGHQTGNLSKDEDQGPVVHLLEMIGEAVRDYQKSRPTDASHPFLARQPARWDYDIWATILGSQGHQAPHIHRSGWLSGCYYARIPDVITADAKDRAGWIEFGRPQAYPGAAAEPRVRACQPYEGMVVLFPSYFYHRTIPFESDDKRISIAFDILPLA